MTFPRVFVRVPFRPTPTIWQSGRPGARSWRVPRRRCDAAPSRLLLEPELSKPCRIITSLRAQELSPDKECRCLRWLDQTGMSSLTNDLQGCGHPDRPEPGPREPNPLAPALVTLTRRWRHGGRETSASTMHQEALRGA